MKKWRLYERSVAIDIIYAAYINPKIFETRNDGTTSVERFDPRQSFNKDHEKVRLGCFLFELVALVVQFLWFLLFRNDGEEWRGMRENYTFQKGKVMDAHMWNIGWKLFHEWKATITKSTADRNWSRNNFYT